MDLMQDNAHTLLRNRAVEEEKDEDKPIVQQDFASQHQHRLLMFQNGQLMQLIQLMLWCGGEEDTHASSTVLQLKSSSSWRGWCIAKMHACILACRLTHHITRFAPLNVFSCKQLNFSWTSINQPLKRCRNSWYKCNSYSLKIPLKPKLWERRSNRLEMNLCSKRKYLNWHSFECESVPRVYFHAFTELPWIWIRFFIHLVLASKKAISDEIWWCIEHLESQIKWDFLNNI